ncbi:hypothetical protein NC653_000923 [Populus alba x Populus x berolinensis]|uniref:Secreted protein n=1 Tax=Populus alba x Populus x berolinensis TaxID=444605 RepID=A0AAD6RKU4_9ROSI|nr:hypothetical protein NC653_000923 [Populus alba x Populus x berolinensis]
MRLLNLGLLLHRFVVRRDCLLLLLAETREVVSVEKKKWTLLGGEVVGEGEFESGARLLLIVVVERRRLILLVRGTAAGRVADLECWIGKEMLLVQEAHYSCFNGGMRVRRELLLLLLLAQGAEKMTLDTAKEDFSLLLKVQRR